MRPEDEECLHCNKLIDCGGTLRPEGVARCMYIGPREGTGTAERTDDNIRLDGRIDWWKVERYCEEASRKFHESTDH